MGGVAAATFDRCSQRLVEALSNNEMAKARALARTAHERNPLSIDPYLAEAAAEQRAKNNAAALAAFQAAVRLQPGNPTAWSSLAEFQLDVLGRPATAKRTLSAALYLDPHSNTDLQTLIQANRAIAAAEARSSKTSKR